MTQDLTDPIPFLQTLIRKPSVTPRDEGAQEALQDALSQMGFRFTRHRFGDVENLYARLGSDQPNFCFAGHTDVVPTGPEEEWTYPPFAAEIHDGVLWGRGTSDMKGAIAAFVAACARYLDAKGQPAGSISLLITGDEEGPAIEGTRKLLPAVVKAGEQIDHALVGEPSNPAAMGDMIKHGRRGSFNGTIRAVGVQGHVAYPHKAKNPVPALLDLLDRLRGRVLDEGAEDFQPSNLEISTIDVGNPAHNVIPGAARAMFNVRFNIAHKGDELVKWVEKEAKAVEKETGVRMELDLRVSGEAFLTQPGDYTDLLQRAVEAETGRKPELSTSGGTSDARFIKDVCPVAEFGLTNPTIHQIDERVSLDDMETLTRIYTRILIDYFDKFGSRPA
ncbi:succinyl-diaminopimelate desuccinylase [Euryhalocaulis sp.]|uniref:succinyl-diaminopimelate desuccinylase n=1 Tax=Euryhalocaulis sp. TaxID=2744307 RepID=UPI002579EAA1|nr:succinyl-diaminopimelate desuccinylase [Euryhalocaulis sp.]